MPLSLHVRYEEQDGSPVVGAAIKAYPLDLPLVFTADGSEADGSEFFAHTASDGTATLTLYWPSEVMTATHGWAVKFPDGTTWAGRVPEGVASVPDILAMHNSYGWRLASGAKGAAIVAVTGSPGLIWKGAWSSTAPYAPHEVVQYSGSAYVALVGTTNVAPGSDPAKWSLLAQAVGGGGLPPGVTGDGGTPGGLNVAGNLDVASISGGGTATDAIALSYSDWQPLTQDVESNAIFDTVESGTASLWDAGTPDTIHLTAGIWVAELSLLFEDVNSITPVAVHTDVLTVGYSADASRLVLVNGTTKSGFVLFLDAPHPLTLRLASTINQGISALFNIVKVAHGWNA